MAKVLIVDDDRLCQKVLSTVFTNAGHEALVASCAEEAWETLQKHVLVDMAVLDNQLEQEWGWQFLRKVRANSAFKGLPVVVYTSNIERNAFTHYATQGVQSMHIKPYQSEVVLAELKKALEAKWTAQVMEPTEMACARLNLSLSGYSAMLATAIRSIEERLSNVRKRIASPNDPALFSALAGITQQCRTVGIHVIDGVVEKVRRSVDAQDTSGALESLQAIESFVGMIRQRMLSVLKMEGAVAPTKLVLTRGEEKALAPEPPATFAAAYARDMISKPLWQFGPAMQRLLAHRLFTEEELAASVSRAGISPPMVALCGSLDLIERSPNLTLDDVLKAARDTRNFAPTYKVVLDRLLGNESAMDPMDKIRSAVEKDGPVKVTARIALARMAASLPKAGLLNQRMLNTHNLAVAGIAIDAGRLFKIANQHMLAGAGLAQGCGQWFFACTEPGIFALALALSESKDVTLEQAEKALFGESHHEVGRRLLQTLDRSRLFQEAAGLHSDPSRVKDREHVITVCVIHLAYLLAQAAIASNAVETKSILSQLRSKDYPVWKLLKAHDVTLTFEEPEIVDTLFEVAGTNVWIANHFLANIG